MAAASWTACSQDDNNDGSDVPTPTAAEPTPAKDPQDQIYLQNVTADKPLLVVYGVWKQAL